MRHPSHRRFTAERVLNHRTAADGTDDGAGKAVSASAGESDRGGGNEDAIRCTKRVNIERPREAIESAATCACRRARRRAASARERSNRCGRRCCGPVGRSVQPALARYATNTSAVATRDAASREQERPVGASPPFFGILGVRAAHRGVQRAGRGAVSRDVGQGRPACSTKLGVDHLRRFRHGHSAAHRRPVEQAGIVAPEEAARANALQWHRRQERAPGRAREGCGGVSVGADGGEG
eukprot:ctg_2129.g556